MTGKIESVLEALRERWIDETIGFGDLDAVHEYVAKKEESVLCVRAVYRANQITRGSAIFLLIDSFGFSWDDAMSFLCDEEG